MAKIEPYKDLQEAFNKAYIGMAKQEWKRAAHVYTGCEYYQPETGLRCAIGHCAPLDMIFDGSDTIVEGPILALLGGNGKQDWIDLFANISPDALDELQHCHDNWSSPEEVKLAFHGFAADYNLTIPEV